MFWRGSDSQQERTRELTAMAAFAALAAIAIWLLARLVWILVPHQGADLAPAPRVGAAEGPAPARSISKWHLFGHTPSSPGAADAPATTLGLILRGTLADQDASRGMAVIDDGQRGERVFRVGDAIVDGVRLAAVYPDRIVLDRNGSEESLKLPRDENLAPADIVRAPKPNVRRSASGASPGGLAARVAAETPAKTNGQAPPDWQDRVRELREHPEDIASRLHVVPIIDGGRLTGVRVSGGGDPAFVRGLGFRPGDVVTAVNGAPVDSLARGQQIIEGLRSASSVNVTVLRDGRPTELTISLQ